MDCLTTQPNFCNPIPRGDDGKSPTNPDLNIIFGFLLRYLQHLHLPTRINFRHSISMLLVNVSDTARSVASKIISFLHYLVAVRNQAQQKLDDYEYYGWLTFRFHWYLLTCSIQNNFVQTVMLRHAQAHQPSSRSEWLIGGWHPAIIARHQRQHQSWLHLLHPNQSLGWPFHSNNLKFSGSDSFF